MEYTRSEYVGSANTDEKFKGTPEEILELISGMNGGSEKGIGHLREYLESNKEELIYDQEDAIDFILEKTKGNIVKKWIGDFITIDMYKEIIRQILNADEDYMRSVGIIEK